MKVYIDGQSRIYIPKIIMSELRLGVADELDLSIQDNKIVLDPGNRYLCNNCEKNLLNGWDNYCSVCGNKNDKC